jgi:hypothetical protein
MPYEVRGQTVHLGRRPTPKGRQLLQAALFMNAAELPTPQPSDWTKEVSNWPMMGNDRYGDCVMAMQGHGIQLATQYGTGTMVTPPDSEIVTDYFNETGGRDIGLNTPDSLDLLHKRPISGQSIDGYGQINHQNKSIVALSCQIFGGVPFDVDLPDNFQTEINAHRPWADTSLPPNPNNGHSILAAGVQVTGPIFITWGMVVPATWAWTFKYAVAAYAVLWTAWRGQRNPAHVDFATFIAAYQAETGKPAPIQPPPPAPTPPPPPVIGDSVGLDIIIRNEQTGANYHATVNNVPRSN